MSYDHFYWMGEALRESALAMERREVPVGAVVVVGDQIVARAHNEVEASLRPTGHAEILAIERAATALGRWRLTDASIYVTLEPCTMCIGAILNARISRLVFGAYDDKAGAVGSMYDLSANYSEVATGRRLEVVSGVRGDDCQEMLVRFFAKIRKQQ